MRDELVLARGAKPSLVSAAAACAVSASKIAGDGGRVERVGERDVGLHVVVLDVDGEQAERRDVAGVGRHQHARAGRACRSSRHSSSEPEPPKVVSVKSRTSRPRLTVTWRSALAWFHAEISRMPVAQRLGRQAELRGERLDAGAGGVDVERDLAAEQVRRDPAEDDVGVGDRDLGAALAVAERAGVGAGRLRADLERALGREPGDRAAAGADGDDVDHRDLRRVGADRALGGQRRLAVDDDGHVGRRAAAVAGQHPVEAGDLGDQRGAERAGGRAGQHGGDRLVHDLVGREHAAVGLHHVERDRPVVVGRRAASVMLVTYAESRGFTAASTRVVIDRSYSRYSRSTSLRDATRRRRGAPRRAPRASAPRGSGWRRRAGSRRRGW